MISFFWLANILFDVALFSALAWLDGYLHGLREGVRSSFTAGFFAGRKHREDTQVSHRDSLGRFMKPGKG